MSTRPPRTRRDRARIRARLRTAHRDNWVRDQLTCPDCPATVRIVGDLAHVLHTPGCPNAVDILRVACPTCPPVPVGVS